MKTALSIGTLALAIAVVAAGCGGDDNDSDAISKSEFLAKGNAICKQGNAEIEAAFNFKGQPTQQQLELAVTEKVAPSIQRQIEEIRALGAPEGDEDQVNSILDEAQAVADQIAADPSSELAAAQGAEDPFAAVGKRLHDYGLTECAE